MESVEKMINLLDAAEFSAAGPVKKDLIKTAGSYIVLVCLETGQVIPPIRNHMQWCLSFSRERGSSLRELLSIQSDLTILYRCKRTRTGESGVHGGWSFLVSARTSEAIREP
jgi:hypothetical protein